jgi:Uma2 family endonuclease
MGESMSNLSQPAEISLQDRIVELNHHNTQSPEHALQQRIGLSQLALLWSRRSWNGHYTYAQDVELNNFPIGARYHFNRYAPDFFITKINWLWNTKRRKQSSYSILREDHVPEVVIEIGASLDNEKDYMAKRDDYLTMGVAEYFIWDLTELQIVCYTIKDDNVTEKYRALRRGHILPGIRHQLYTEK